MILMIIFIYYMLKYISNGNVIIVSSYSGDTIPKNIKDYQDILNGTFDILRIERIIGDKLTYQMKEFIS